MQDDIDMEPLHKLFIYRKKLVKPYIERLLKWMDGITYMMSALFILTLVYEHGFLISFEEMEMINDCRKKTRNHEFPLAPPVHGK